MTLQSTLAAVNKKFGPATVIRGSALKNTKTLRATSGSFALDVALGGGWPLNQWHEIIGEYSAGKTLLAAKTIAANQALDPKWTCAYVMAEALDLPWVEQCGVDLSRLIIIDTSGQEEAFDISLDFLRSRDIDCLVIDSLPLLLPMAEELSDMDEHARVAAAAYNNGKFFRKANKAIKRSMIEADRPVLPIIINQWREKIVTHGDPRTTPGGRAKNFAFWTRVEMRRDEWIKDADKNLIGQKIHMKVSKNKSAPPMREAYVNFYFDDGGPVPIGQYDRIAEVGSAAQAFGVVAFKGAKWRFNGDEIAKTKDQLPNALRAEPELLEAVEQAVLEAAAPKYSAPPEPVKRAPVKKSTRTTAKKAPAKKAAPPRKRTAKKKMFKNA